MKSYLRSYQSKNVLPQKKAALDGYTEPERVFVFDTETTADEYQNLKFGSFQLFVHGQLEYSGHFYEATNNTSQENKVITSYCKENHSPLYTRAEFVKKVFYPELFKLETLCVGFNLPFDLSRLATRFGTGTKDKEALVLLLTESPYLPRIRVHHIDSTKSFIGFSGVLNGRKRGFKGNFLDLKTLATAITSDKHLSLERCAEIFNLTNRKQHTETHGKITHEYIEYNKQDVTTTAELYFKLLAEFKTYNLDMNVTSVFSEASLGKQALRQLGIKPFIEQNPEFPKELLGQLMSAYFGGRVECKIRRQPTPVTTLDFLSMYPTTFTLMNLWEHHTAEKITYEDCTEETQELLNNITLEDLQTPERWKDFVRLVQLRPQGDILPIRANYDETSTIPNIGINEYTIDEDKYYALPDVIASKILKGKTPIIKKAIRFIPNGKQTTLRPATLFGITIDPSKENFIKKIIEQRQEHKTKAKNDPTGYHDNRQRGLKILASSTTYGIFIQTTTTTQNADVTVYSDETFETNTDHYEKIEEFFNPVIAVHQIAGSRLLLAMAEAKLRRLGLSYSYMDTDSIYVPPQAAKTIQDIFAKLNPYNFKADILKVEKTGYLFYGISSKRYCLYKYIDGKIIIEEGNYSLHGLGHITNPFSNGEKHWHRTIWEDILKLHYDIITEAELHDKYGRCYMISQQTVSTPLIYKRFTTLNENKPFSQQIKPFNFFLEGLGIIKNGELIKPIVPFTKQPQTAPFKPFTNYKSGKQLQGEEYWQTLDRAFFDYVNHSEQKFEDGDKDGELQRRKMTHMKTTYIGKEVKNIEQPSAPTELKKHKGKEITNLSILERRKQGISRQKYDYWKKKHGAS